MVVEESCHYNKMSDTVINYADLLRSLCKSKPKIRKSILKTADSGLVKAICECVKNVLNGCVTISKRQKAKLAPHRRILHKLIRKDGKGWKEKKKYLNQKGGAFLPLLLAPLITGVLGSLFK